MGGAHSKRTKDNFQGHLEEGPNEQDVDSEDIRVDSVNRLDEQCISTIKKDLNETPELFVLNNVLMSIMFFENYQKEIQEVSSKRYNKDEECISPDIILEQVNKNVLYRPLHGPKKYFSEPLVAKRLYVVNNSIHVVDYLDSTSDVGSAALQLEESPRKGYVKLREREFSSSPIEDNIPVVRTEITPSNSRSSTDSDTTYEYSTLTSLKTPKPIEIVKELERQDRLPNLPGSCIAFRRVRKQFYDLDDLEEQYLDDVSEDDLYDVVAYISSRGYMKYFENSLFPNSVGLNLGFDPDELSLAKSIPIDGKIFCNLNNGGTLTPCEVLPAVTIQWPHKPTLEFLMKGQKPPEARKRYIFPTERMTSEIKALNCVLVPKGYIKKKGMYQDSDIEWEIHFPQAERYLETFMSHAQAKSFLFLLTLHKTYIEPKTLQHGLLSEHIRHFILWECESNYSEWPEHRLGSKLIQVLKKFNSCISKRRLPDYFISEKNIFENIPKKYLTHAHKVFHDILESPVMSFIKSLRNLRYTKGKSFYPPFDFDRLYGILVKSGIESTNPQLISELSIPPNYRRRRYHDSDVQLKHILEIKRRERELKKRQVKPDKENLNVEERRESVDSLNMDWICEKQFDVYKKRSLLTFFIENFIDIAEKCAQISSHKQTLLYLKQAKYLTRILGDECPAMTEEVAVYMETILRREELCNKKAHGKGHNSQILEEEPVQYNNTNASNKISESCNNNAMLKVNGIRPRKSVAFVEIH